VSQLRELKRPRIEKNVQKKPISIRQQLTNWGVRKDTIDIWLANIDKKTINDAIKKTINRPKPKDKSRDIII
jgi:SOS response regulatory protein OraA/RecX